MKEMMSGGEQEETFHAEVELMQRLRNREGLCPAGEEGSQQKTQAQQKAGGSLGKGKYATLKGLSF